MKKTIMLVILAISIVVLIGCKGKEPPAEPPTEPEAKQAAEPEAEPAAQPETEK